MTIHIIKLVVGCDTLDQFTTWQAQHQHDYNGCMANTIHTRHMPKQAEEIVREGGSAYRVIKGNICCRQQIIGFDRYDTEDGRKCIIYTKPDIIRTAPMPRRAFQGWRYLKADDAPSDIGPYEEGSDEAMEIQIELKALGLL